MDATPIYGIETLLRLGVALALGLLVGLERGWWGRVRGEGERVAGIRTFGIVGLLGGFAALLSETFGAVAFAVFGGALALLLAAAYWRAVRERDDLGVTTMVAALLTFALGATAGMGQLLFASVGAVALTAALSIKPELHALVRRIERRELFATIQMLLLSVVILPALPDHDYGPWGALNPYRIWLMVVLIAGVSYAGYLAIKLIGETRGILAVALLGGIASSTAVAVGLARLDGGVPANRRLLTGSIAGASSIMLLRMILVVAIVAPALVPLLAIPLASAGIIGLGFAGWLALGARQRAHPESVQGLMPKNPLDLKLALQFGLLLSAVLILSRALKEWAGATGLYALATVSGLADVDAITISLAEMFRDADIAAPIAATATVLAAATNTLIKPVLVAFIAGPRMGLLVAGPLAAALAGGAAALWLTAS
ncbi:MAG TPA: MgtC/SapB family protein [Rhodospirillales bacterium]|nr:MgtC/SapB family protein [Rhodospirillales bacterium]